MTEYYLNHLKTYDVDLTEIIIQTDNGSEFGGGKKNIQTSGFVNTIVCGYNAGHQYIPPGMSNANADVESVHSTIEKEFFDIESFANVQDFWVKVQAYQLFYNLVRPNHSKAGKTPSQMILEERPSIDPKILFFPVLDLDKEFRKLHGLEKNDALRGQTLPKLPARLKNGSLDPPLKERNCASILFK